MTNPNKISHKNCIITFQYSSLASPNTLHTIPQATLCHLKEMFLVVCVANCATDLYFMHHFNQ